MNTPLTIELHTVKDKLTSITLRHHDSDGRFLRAVNLRDIRSLRAAELFTAMLEVGATGQAVQVMPPVLEGEVIDDMAVLFDDLGLFPAGPSRALKAGCPECAALPPNYFCELHFGGWD